MKRISTILAAMTLLLAPSSMATSYILSFSGQSDVGISGATPSLTGDSMLTYSGSIVLDYSTADVQPFDGVGSYDGIVSSASVTINGITYTGPSGVINIGGVSNDDPTIGDFFGVGVHLDDGKDDSGFFAIQFQDSSGLSFMSDGLPTAIDFAAFDAFDANNSFSTGVFLPLFDGSGGASMFLSIDSASITAVPLPAGVWLMISAVSTLLWRRRTS